MYSTKTARDTGNKLRNVVIFFFSNVKGNSVVYSDSTSGITLQPTENLWWQRKVGMFVSVACAMWAKHTIRLTDIHENSYKFLAIDGH